MISTLRKLMFILNPSDRFRALRLLFIMLVAVLLETLGISLILPITSIMIEEDITQITLVVAISKTVNREFL